jgi:hypothetical protein
MQNILLSFQLVLFVALGMPLANAAGPAKGADPAEDVSVPDGAAAAMLGTYVGEFGPHKITICFDRIVGDTLTGYSITAGNERAFSGAWEPTVDGFALLVREPGDHPQDGVFKILFFSKPKSISGIWTPNDAKLEKRTFNLPARDYKFDPNAGAYPQSSSRLLTEVDVENLRPSELRIMRNEIYARHGYSFKLAEMRAHFDPLPWYMPAAVNITTKLTDIEKKNAALIKRYEAYTSEYYDDFGR